MNFQSFWKVRRVAAELGRCCRQSLAIRPMALSAEGCEQGLGTTRSTVDRQVLDHSEWLRDLGPSSYGR